MQKIVLNLKKQSGMTLTESLLVLGVGALVAVLAYGGYKMATENVKSGSQINGTIQLVGSIKRVFGPGSTYTPVTLANVVNANIVPSDFRADSTPSITNSWGGNIVPAVGNQAGTTPTSQFKLTISGVSKESCMDFVAGIASSATSLWVNGTTAGTHDVKPIGGAYDATRASVQCNSGPGDIILVSQ
jgi:prepilin-type N-terminal cleavage/methylation domain-containing protein